MNKLKKCWYIFLTIFYKVRNFFLIGRINALKEQNEKMKIALGRHDFPTSYKSTRYPDDE